MDPGLSIRRTLAELSREYGGPEYVLGGGGNTSCKDEKTLWIKPSGTRVYDMTPDSFVAMDRAKIAEAYVMPPPETAVEREKALKDVMLAAVLPGSKGRPSVEAPVHNLFEATYVIHVHPPLVNGLTCANDGRSRAAELFPEAAWVECSVGFMLNRAVKKRMNEKASILGREPGVVLMENHGIIVAGGAPGEIRDAFEGIMGELAREYEKAGVDTDLAPGEAPSEERAAQIEAMIRGSVGEADGASVSFSGPFDAPEGPVSPDHIVYAKAWYLHGEPTQEAVEEFKRRRGFPPRVVVLPEGVFGLGPNEDTARLALEFARDAARVLHLAKAFGGLKYLDERWSDFIENWEVEAYRRKLAREGKA